MKNSSQTTSAVSDLFGALFDNTAELTYRLAPGAGGGGGGGNAPAFNIVAANDDFGYDTLAHTM